MKAFGLLILLALGLLVTYYIADDYLTASGGGSSDSVKFEPMKITKEVTEKFGAAQEDMKRKIEKATTEGEKKE